ncbi:MAG TPA: PspC domain-containing protein [Bacteroidales bacterium]|mgnify:CR=1 FL=1|jgi:phage shock protein PspC (stress-responsive transcriptional regulator)|nr:PspC domain-containing protein [Bacteroidales bacterium]HNR40881.1 PspC domain-containing protein [Bacteroidales bacterium]HPM17683.1 PspC domain-containing protein [Bacteroidales bacterium]HQG78160.1 PspC domain-containing protein [Bacteroidales bacterium]
MKITVSINLGGYSFNIDEDAYTELKRYLKSLEFNLAGEESSAEIISDIEARMAELFRARLTGYKQVITITDVRDVIAVMGNPEDISDKEGMSSGAKFTEPGAHRMYRDPDRRIIGGVCAGIGAFWQIEPWIVRVIFIAVAMAGGLGILVYLILYIVLPEARTTAQKIEMKGDPVNIHNIKEAVKREFDNVRKNMNL